MVISRKVQDTVNNQQCHLQVQWLLALRGLSPGLRKRDNHVAQLARFSRWIHEVRFLSIFYVMGARLKLVRVMVFQALREMRSLTFPLPRVYG